MKSEQYTIFTGICTEVVMGSHRFAEVLSGFLGFAWRTSIAGFFSRAKFTCSVESEHLDEDDRFMIFLKKAGTWVENMS